MTTETRTGFAFNNPDITNNYLAPSFGMIVTADELRYDELFGNPLISEADSMAMTDDQLQNYSRVATGIVERELNIDILPRLIRYDDPIGEDGTAETRTDIDDTSYLAKLKTGTQLSELYIREIGYPYRVIAARKECRVKLRRRPVRDVLTANFVDPYFGNTIIDLMPYRIVKKGLSGVCYFRPRQLSSRSNTFQYLFQRYLTAPFMQDLQDVFRIDYTSGYENCSHVPEDLRYIIKKLAALMTMATYGDGKFAAIANRSVSLNSVTESIGTTQSATSAAFGARILMYQKEVKEWFAQNRQKYSRTLFGSLG